MDIESPSAPKPNLKWIPVIGLCVSVYSALFATFILYPWHIELSREFKQCLESIDRLS